MRLLIRSDIPLRSATIDVFRDGQFNLLRRKLYTRCFEVDGQTSHGGGGQVLPEVRLILEQIVREQSSFHKRDSCRSMKGWLERFGRGGCWTASATISSVKNLMSPQG
jgi:hypothetical protein